MRYYTVAGRLSPPAIGVGPGRVNLDQYRTRTTQHYESPQTVSLPAFLPACLSPARLQSVSHRPSLYPSHRSLQLPLESQLYLFTHT